MGNTDFSVEDMGEKIGFSRVQLYRKAKALTGYTPNELLRIARLNKANAIIKTATEKSISEIAYEVGFHPLRTSPNATKNSLVKVQQMY